MRESLGSTPPDLGETPIPSPKPEDVNSEISTPSMHASTNAKNEIAHQDAQFTTISGWLGLDAFPTLHSLVVHLSLVLLPFAVFLLLIEWRSRPRKTSLAVILSVLGGTSGALIACFWLHLHVESLSSEAFIGTGGSRIFYFHLQTYCSQCNLFSGTLTNTMEPS